MTKEEIIKKFWPKPQECNILNIPVMREAIGKMMDEAMGVVHKVTGCIDCPFHIISQYYEASCAHPVGAGRNLGDYQNTTPDWCPLNTDSITISKTKDNDNSKTSR